MTHPATLIISLFLIGIALIMIEITVIPGVGVVGLLGFCAIIAASILLATHTNIFFAGLLLFVALVIALAFLYVFPKTRFGQRFVLSSRQKRGGAFPDKKRQSYDNLLGKVGVSLSALRPAGSATIEDRHVDVVTEGDFIEAGQSIKVVAIEGSKVTVERN